MKIRKLMPSLGLLLSALAAFSPSGIAASPLDIYWIDVEGGAATLIVTPEHESVLIDSGSAGLRDAERIHAAALKAGIKRIDYFLLTHFHGDHFGGIPELAQMMPVGIVYDNGIPDRNPDNNPADTRFPLMIKPYREMKTDDRRIIQVDDAIPLKSSKSSPKLVLHCLGARQSFTKKIPAGASTNSICREGAQKEKDITDNANSVVMLLDYGNFRFYVGGDLTWNVEANLVCPINLVGKVDVYQVEHHGLDVSNNPLLVHSLEPTVAVMSNGTIKGCQPETFRTLKETPSIKAIYQIHRNLREDSEHNTSSGRIANLEKDCQGNLIKLSVADDGESYVLSVPATGQKEEFATRKKD